MNSFQKRIFSGAVRPIIFVLVFALAVMIAFGILQILAPEHLYISLKDMLAYVLTGAFWVYFVMRALWYASERKQRGHLGKIKFEWYEKSGDQPH
jgi:hypothetical protein